MSKRSQSSSTAPAVSKYNFTLSLEDRQKLFELAGFVFKTASELAPIVQSFDNNPEFKWRFYGDNDGNLSIIKMNAGSPASALVEQGTNSIDAVNQKYHNKTGFEPRNYFEAMDNFYGFKNGEIIPKSKEAKEHRKHIVGLAEGRTDKPTINWIDEGKGLDPREMPRTIMALNKSNKKNLSYAQGFHGMGGSGVLLYSSYKFVACRIHPDLTPDGKGGDIGFTIARLIPVKRKEELGLESPCYEYLVDKNNTVLTIPAQYVDFTKLGLDENIIFGCWTKMFDYNLENPQSIVMKLRPEIAKILVRPALPIWLIDFRDGVSEKGRGRAVYGMFNTMAEQLETPSFMVPCSIPEYNIRQAEVFIFKHDSKLKQEKGKTEEESLDIGWSRDPSQSVMFTIRGQVHGKEDRAWLKRKTGLDALARYILVNLDLSDMPKEGIRNEEDDGRTLTSVISPDRRHMLDNRATTIIKDTLSQSLTVDPTVQHYETEYSRLQSVVENADDLMNAALKDNPDLAQYLEVGIIEVPIKDQNKKNDVPYVGLEPPTFLRVENCKEEICHRSIPKDSHPINLVLLTNATNDYMNGNPIKGIQPKGAVKGSDPDLDINIHRAFEGRIVISVGLKKGHILQPSGTDVLFTLTREGLAAIKCDSTIHFEEYTPEPTGARRITIMMGAANGSAPVVVDPPEFRTRQGFNVVWFNDDAVDHNLELREAKTNKKIWEKPLVVEKGKSAKWHVPDDIEGAYIYNSIQYNRVYGTIIVRKRKKILSTAANIPKMMWYTSDGRNGTNPWDEEWNEDKACERKIDAEGNFETFKANLDYKAFRHYRDKYGGFKVEPKIRERIELDLRTDAIGVHNHLKELEEKKEEDDKKLQPWHIEESFCTTMAGISDVLMILADMKRHRRKGDDDDDEE